MMGREKYEGGKKQLKIWSLSHHLSNMVEARYGTGVRGWDHVNASAARLWLKWQSRLFWSMLTSQPFIIFLQM